MSADAGARRFQRSEERPRSAREITADVDPDYLVALGESRYHDAIRVGDDVINRCGDVDAEPARLADAARRGLRPCGQCSPPEYLADPGVEDVVENRDRDDLADALDRLDEGALVGLTWRTTRGTVTVEGHCVTLEEPAELARVDSPARETPVVVRRDAHGVPTAVADTTEGDRPLGELLDVLPLDPPVDGQRVAPDGGQTLEAEAEALAREVGQVVDRHPELLRAAPHYVAAQLLAAVDTVVDKHGLDVDVENHDDDHPEVWSVRLTPPERVPLEAEVGEFLGAPRRDDGLVDVDAHPAFEDGGRHE